MDLGSPLTDRFQSTVVAEEDTVGRESDTYPTMASSLRG